jgi:hypothetical protein
MGHKLRRRVVTAILLFLLLVTAFSTFAEEKEKLERFEVLFAGGASYATSRFGFSPGVSFSFYPMRNLVLSFDFGVAYHIPELDFRQFGEPVKEAAQAHIDVRVKSQYRLFSSLSAEYSFDISPRLKPFLTAGIGWCRDYLDITVYGWYYPDPSGYEYEFHSEDVKYRQSGSPLLLVGGGVRYPVRKNEVLKVMVRVLDPGGDFAIYQLIAGWGFRF